MKRYQFQRGLIVFTILILCVGFGSIEKNEEINYNEWYLPTEDKNSYLFIHEAGVGEPVIVLNGGPGAPHQYMLPIANGLCSDYRFIFYDQRGAGISYCEKDSVSLQKHIADIEWLRKSLGLEKVNIISHSFGTQLAMNYLQAFPVRVKNLVLLGALDPKNGSREFFTDDELDLFKKKNYELKQFESRPEVAAEIKKFGLDKPVLTPKEKDMLRAIKGSASGDIYHINRWRERLAFMVNWEGATSTMKSTNFRYDWSKLLASHSAPVTVINGEYDYVVGPKGSPIWKRVVRTEAKNVNLVIIPNAGHLSWIDEPGVLKDYLIKALK